MTAVNQGLSETADAVERLLLDEARDAEPAPRRVAALDVSPATALALAQRAGSGRCAVWVDSWRAESELRALGSPLDVTAAYGAELLQDADLVVMRMPRSLDALAERAAAVAAYAAPDVVLLAGGRVKHLSRGMNEVLARSFADVRASLGRQKSRVLIASTPKRGLNPSSRGLNPSSRGLNPSSRGLSLSKASFDKLRTTLRQAQGTSGQAQGTSGQAQGTEGLTVMAHGGAFAGTSIDLGTRALLEAFVMPSGAVRAADLGCGTGILACTLAKTNSELRVIAADDSAVACWSATATAAANDVSDQVEVRHGDLLAGTPDASLDVVVCNPPFHRGPAKDSTDAFRMITEAARVLRPGGQLWLVFNSHLPYLQTANRVVGRTVIISRTSGYLVTRSTRR